MKKLLLTLPLLIFAFSTVNAATPSVSSCPQYVPENTALSCSCTPVNCSVRVNISWDGQLQSSAVLFLSDVRRENNGTKFTCRLDCGGQISTATYTLQVAYGPTSDRISIHGNSSFRTDGTRTLNLTCLATDLHPAPTYSWLDSLCTNNSQGNTCSFVPQRVDDGKTVTCLVSNTFTYRQEETNLILNLTYTPPASPHIQGPGQILTAGDTLSCTVTGGKPLVQSVHFSCDNPHHPDQNDAVNGSISVTSYITINTSQANEHNITCQCSAHWVPEQSYYPTIVSAGFRMEYPATMIALTMNELNGTVTVNGPTNVTLKCEAHGRPRPNITLQGPNQNDLTGNVTHSDDAHIMMEHTILAENDTHMGNYTCISNNGVGKVADKLITLNVDFPPRLNSSDGPGHSPDSAVNMSQHGINITLRAFPSPHIFRFTGYKDKVGHAGNISLDYMFNATTSERIPGSPEVTCHIRPEHSVQKGRLYEVNISNGVGSVLYYFSVTGAPPPPEVTTSRGDHLAPTDDDDLPVIIGASVGGAVAGVLLIIIIVCCCCKKKIKDERKKPDARFFNVGSAEGSSNPTFNTDNQDADSGIGDRESPPLDMSTSKPSSKPAQHDLDAGYVDVGAVRDGVMRNKSARGGQPYEVTSLVKGGGARIAGETTKPPATNSKVGYTEPWPDYHIDMPDGQPSVNKPLADTTTVPAGNNASPDHYQGPRGEEYASVGAHGKGGPHSYINVDSKQKGKPPYSNVPDDRTTSGVFESPGYATSHNKGTKTSGKRKQSGAVSMDARGSDTYDHFGGQGHDLTQHADPTYNHIGKF